MAMEEFKGGCHCGNIAVVFRTAVPPEQASPRACQCSFCRKHNTRTVSDPSGTLLIEVREEAQLVRYRFGLGLSDYLICRACGVYAGAFMTDTGAARVPVAHGHATLMVTMLEAEARFPQAAPVVYDSEDAASRRARRHQRWTPATLTVRG